MTQTLDQIVAQRQLKWLVTGAAGFIGSNLVEYLLNHGQSVVGLDNFATGHRRNLDQVQTATGDAWRERMRFIEGDITDFATCADACEGVDIILHQAALGSVPRSIKDPVASNNANVTGFVTMLAAANAAGIKRFVYASSSSVYGDSPQLPKVEAVTGNLLSPYAVTKYANELYAGVFYRTYGLECIGLRYFNVFGRRQDPEGAYAAVMPKWIAALLRGEGVQIYGDGTTSRDFCYIDNVVEANILAALTDNAESFGEAFNIAVGGRTTLTELFGMIRDTLRAHDPQLALQDAEYTDFRPGDIKHSLADISKAQRVLGYNPRYSIKEGLEEAIAWYVDDLS